MEVIKILGDSTRLSGIGTTVSSTDGVGAKYVLLQHVGSNNHVVIQKSGIGTQIGSINLPPDSLITIKKERTDTLEVTSGNDVYATSIAYQG